MLERYLEMFRKVIFYKTADTSAFSVAPSKYEDKVFGKCYHAITRNHHFRTQKMNSDEKKHTFTKFTTYVTNVFKVLKFRYFVLGSMVGGGFYFLKWKNSFPNFTWFHDIIPKNEQFDSFFKKVKFFSNGFQTTDEIEKKIKELQSRLYNTHAEYKEKLQKIYEENKKLRGQLFCQNGYIHTKKKIHKSLIDMYSEVMDDLSEYDSKFKSHDQLPKVVVVGDKAAGKTSVLEMIVQAQIFPRRNSELIARVPIKVTINEGPYHVAQFRGNDQEYDLAKEKDLEELRNQMEYYLLKSTSQTSNDISNDFISITVEGPRLHEMVLVNLPAVAMNKNLKNNSKEYVTKIKEQYLSNPNALFLCIHDATTNLTESEVINLVSQVDPHGKRTVHVLNKVDLADNDCVDPLKFEKILSGQSFPKKAIGYFAVVAGRGRKNDSIKEIQQYEDDFFKSSKLFDIESVKSQLTTRNLSRAISDRFWKMVKETVEQQADTFKAAHFNLKTEWKNSYRGLRELDRDELFDKARSEILDEIMSLREVTVKQWEEIITKRMWEKVSQHVFDSIYQPSADHDDMKMINTSIDIKLRQWANQTLPTQSVEVGWEVLKDKFSHFILKDIQDKNRDDVFDQLKDRVMLDVTSQHIWESKANEVLRVIQLNVLEDCSIQEKSQWDSAIQFLENNLREKLKEAENQIRDAVGPGLTERWLSWKYRTEEQNKKNAIKLELEKNKNYKYSNFLKNEESKKIKDNLQANGLDVGISDIISVWQPLSRKMFIKNRLNAISGCRGHYNDYHSGVEVKCGDVVLFWRIQQMLKVTANALRQQIMNREIQHLDREVEEILEGYNRDPQKKYSFLTGRRVDLAEELMQVHLKEMGGTARLRKSRYQQGAQKDWLKKRVKKICVKLEEFIQALKKEKRERTMFNDTPLIKI